MNIPETFYIALCVTILLLGIVYWFWTQVQYLQRKVNLLDNVVYEMKTFIANLPGPVEQQQQQQQQPRFEPQHVEQVSESPVATVYSAPPESVAGDLEAERLASEIEFEVFSGGSSDDDNRDSYLAPLEEGSDEGNGGSGSSDSNGGSGSSDGYGNNGNSGGNGSSGGNGNDENDELQPGGLALADDTKKVTAFSDSSIESPLSSMSIKELRRMAEANNIPGSAELRKKDLIKALRDKVGQIISGEQPKDNGGVLSFDEIEAPNA
jgi:hypothetical protein